MRVELPGHDTAHRFNRDDPAVLIEKRFGIGYTLNLARPMSWTIILLVLLLPAVLVLLRHF